MITSLPISVISLLSSLTAVIFVCVLKLHKTLVYRLALYQVLSAMECSIVWITAAVLEFASLPHLVSEVLLIGSAFIKLMLIVWIAIHLFALAVFHKNLQRLEPLYVVSSLLVPLVVTAALLGVNLTQSNLQEACGLSEGVVYGIVFSVLVLISLFIVVMGTILCHRACRRRSLALSEYDKQHKKALYEMLPLLLYPIFCLLFTTPIFVSASAEYIMQQFVAVAISNFIYPICSPLCSFTTSLLFIFHLFVVRHVRKQNRQRIKRKVLQNVAEEASVTVTCTKLSQTERSDTHFTAPYTCSFKE